MLKMLKDSRFFFILALYLAILCCFLAKLHSMPPVCSDPFMGARDVGLAAALTGYKETGVSLVAKKPFPCYGYEQYSPAGYTDDPGLYYFVTKIAFFYNLDLAAAKKIFIYLCEALTIVIMTLGMMLLFIKNPKVMVLAILGAVVLSLYAFSLVSEVYIAPFLAIACVPLILFAYNLSLSQKRWLFAALLLFSSGIVATIANFIRSHAGTGLIVFVVLITLLHLSKLGWRKSILLTSAFFIGLIFAKGFFISLENQRDNFLAKHEPTASRTHVTHPFWHSAYIGLGFLPNPYGIKWDDSVSDNKARSVDNKVCYLSTRYEQILRAEYIKLFLQDPKFVFSTYYAKAIASIKAIYLSSEFLLIWWSGLLMLLFARVSTRIWLPFLALSSFYLLNGILVHPWVGFSIGCLISMQLLALYGICEFMNKHFISRKKTHHSLQ